MGKTDERAIQVENGKACPQCLAVYPAPTAYAETVTCGTCGFCHCLLRAADASFVPRGSPDIGLDTIMPTNVPFYALGKLRHLDPDYRAAKQRESWTWIQPVGIDALLSRLADARDFAVPERERENLCSVAHGEISRLVGALQSLVDDSYSLIEQPSWIRPATGLGVYRCHQCEATKGERRQGHVAGCAVGRAEAILRR